MMGLAPNPFVPSEVEGRGQARRVSTQPVLGLAGGQTRGLDTNGSGGGAKP
jgi:hypothetical protein